jgi:hypothetical protein
LNKVKSCKILLFKGILANLYLLIIMMNIKINFIFSPFKINTILAFNIKIMKLNFLKNISTIYYTIFVNDKHIVMLKNY